MTAPVDCHRLEGLEPDNLLAFLALLGLLRALEVARPGWHPRAAWDLKQPPVRPLLILAEPQMAVICEAAAEGAGMLAPDYNFPQSIDNGAEPQVDLNYAAKTARRLLERVANSPDRRCADLWSALMCDAAVNDEEVEATPLCLLFGQGHQHFLDRLASVARQPAPQKDRTGKRIAAQPASECFAGTLIEPWRRVDNLSSSFRWDPAEDVRYALMVGDPTQAKYKIGTQHGANRLAALGLSVLTVAPTQGAARVRLQVLGGAFKRNEFIFSWPIWKGPASLVTIRALLSHPELAKGPPALSHLGVVEIRSARRIGVGKFMNFTRADPVKSG